MDQPQMQKIPGKPRVLVAPLDWGLGHATRCVPIIHELIRQGAEVKLAGEAAQAALLRTEFPQLELLHLEGYRIKYARTRFGLIRNIIAQTPRMYRVISEENKRLFSLVENGMVDAVISDNRYGLFHFGVPTAFITHQLHIKTPLWKWTERGIQKNLYRYIDLFTECWVPDLPGENNLAGELSHPKKNPAIPVKYTGPLSRFTPLGGKPQPGHLLFIISGPEPQRSIIEEKIIKEVATYENTATIVRGLPAEQSIIPSTNMIHFYNHLPAEALNREIEKAEFVISRSGYSTVMDLAALNKKSILIPTPGQTEQEYLGRYLMEKKFALSVKQDDFTLAKALELAHNFDYKMPVLHSNGQLQKTIASFLERVNILQPI